MKITTIAVTAPVESCPCPSLAAADVLELLPPPVELELVNPASRVLELADGLPFEGPPVGTIPVLATWINEQRGKSVDVRKRQGLECDRVQGK